MTAINPTVALHTHKVISQRLQGYECFFFLLNQECHSDRRVPTSALFQRITSLILHKHNRNPNHISYPVCLILRSPKITRQQPTHGSCCNGKLGFLDALKPSRPLHFKPQMSVVLRVVAGVGEKPKPG